MNKLNIPKWQNDLSIYKSFKTTFIIDGNVNDMQVYINSSGESYQLYSMGQFLYNFLADAGYDAVAFYNRVDGFYNRYNSEHIK